MFSAIVQNGDIGAHAFKPEREGIFFQNFVLILCSVQQDSLLVSLILYLEEMYRYLFFPQVSSKDASLS